MSESKEEKHEVYRVTSLKSNGSVWTKQYDGEIDWNKVVPLLLSKFPHILLSKQTLKQTIKESCDSRLNRQHHEDVAVCLCWNYRMFVCAFALFYVCTYYKIPISLQGVLYHFIFHHSIIIILWYGTMIIS